MSRQKKALQRLYTDEISVYRHQVVVGEDGTSNNILEDVPFLVINGRFSFRTSDRARSDNETHNPLEIVGTIFCDNTYEIKKGQRATVVRENGITYTGVVGEASVYTFHQQLELNKLGYA